MIEYENLMRLNSPFVDEYLKKFNEVVNRGWYILGDQVREFEREFAAYCEVDHCAGVANGLDALIIALRVLGLPPGKEVLVPANTYIATILSIMQCGLTPVLVEPKIDSYNIDPEKIEEAITPESVAIMVVHLYGKCCEMDKIKQLATQYNLKLIEDCAQAHGAMFKNKMAGTFGDMGAFSFYPTKNLGALGDGGCILAKDSVHNDTVTMYRNYGSSKKYHNDIIGVNSRLDELQAAFLRVKLKHLNSIIEHKRKLAAIYLQLLKSDFIKPHVHPDYFDVYHIFNIRHPKRDELKEYLLKNGITTEIHYPIPPHKQRCLNGVLPNKRYPLSEEIHSTTLSLPISLFHSEEDIHYIVDVLNKF